MTCKECIHYEVCLEYGLKATEYGQNFDKSDISCDHFKKNIEGETFTFLFSKRSALSKICEEYIGEQNLHNDALTVITVLYANDLLNIPKAIEFIEKNAKEKNNDQI